MAVQHALDRERVIGKPMVAWAVRKEHAHTRNRRKTRATPQQGNGKQPRSERLSLVGDGCRGKNVFCTADAAARAIAPWRIRCDAQRDAKTTWVSNSTNT